MTDMREHRAWVQSLTQLRVAMRAMDSVAFLGIDPSIQAECREMWERMDELKSKMVRRIEQMEEEE